MNWYAVSTMPGAQTPHRETWKEIEDEDGNFVRPHWRSSVDPLRSHFEVDLERKGFVGYMPVEYVPVRSRTKTRSYEIRRFAMMKGYAFVEADPSQFLSVCDMKTVYDFVRNQGEPIIINRMDIHRLRMIEAASKAAATAQIAQLQIKDDRGSKRAAQSRKAAIKAAKKKLFPSRRVKLLWGKHVGREATVEAWKDEGFVQVLVDRLDAASEQEIVPYDYLKAAE